jgi:hypothetical protein
MIPPVLCLGHPNELVLHKSVYVSITIHYVLDKAADFPIESKFEQYLISESCRHPKVLHVWNRPDISSDRVQFGLTTTQRNCFPHRRSRGSHCSRVETVGFMNVIRPVTDFLTVSPYCFKNLIFHKYCYCDFCL